MLPAAVILVGVLAVVFLERHDQAKAAEWQASRDAAPAH
jgi:hypothetical protein